ncbi:MAG: GGDEF domain-containing protein [Desulfobacteraceae bacterium]|nr:GGDEF domain-containing protein [Desulfobacteraceae bacterium]MBC2757587.1 GGDEF domain-containing protein [Desulfobacteraceae bacterium]
MNEANIDKIQFKLMLDQLNKNEKIQHKFHELESKILSILNFQDFFEILLTEMGKIFNVPYVWLSVIKNSSLANLINPLIDSKIIIEKTNFISRSEFDDIFGNISTPHLFNKALEPYAVFLPRDKKYHTGSMAIAPVQIDGEIVGSLNQWDQTATRFEPGIDTSSLEQLMIKVSLCLSNVAAHEKLKYFAYHDPLTGLLNRRAFETVLNREFSRSKRHSNNLSLVFLDLDKFKRINDQYGHDAGDDTLVYVAETLQSIIREEDIVARFAGDEFVIILPETKADKSETLMKRVQVYLDSHPLNHNGANISISLSYGITSTQDMEINSSAVLLKKADEKLYFEKEKKAGHFL